MKDINKLIKIVEDSGTEVKWCTATNKVFINGYVRIKKNMPDEPLFIEIMKKLKRRADNDADVKYCYELLCEFAKNNTFDSVAEKKAEKKKEQAAKEKAKKKEQAEKKAAKEQEQAEKKAAKEKEQAEKKAAKEQEQAEKKAAKEKEKAAKEEAKEQAKRDEYDKNYRASSGEKWQELCDRTPKGNIKPNSAKNMAIYFGVHDHFKGNLKYNEFSSVNLFNAKGKWKPIDENDIFEWSIMTESDLDNNSTKMVESAVKLVCSKHSYHPLKEALDHLINDAEYKDLFENKIDFARYLIDHIGAEDKLAVKEMTMKYFYAMFKRLLDPGCTFDHILITVDETHGTGKTSIFNVLLEALQKEFNISDEDCGIISLPGISYDKDLVQCLNKAWIASFDELAAMIKTDPDDIKKFITQRNDNVRLSYAKDNKNYPRHCVFYGSTNNKDFIRDMTDDYERRFWIIDCEGIKHEAKDYWDFALPHRAKLAYLAQAYKFYLDHPYFEYNELSVKASEQLKEIQKGHKTTNRDSALIRDLLTIMDFKFEDPNFTSWYNYKVEVEKQWRELQQYGSISSDFDEKYSKNYEKSDEFDEFFNENDEKTNEKLIKTRQKMNKIPKKWVLWIAQTLLGSSIKDENLIKNIVGSKWANNKNGRYGDGNQSLRGTYDRIE